MIGKIAYADTDVSHSAEKAVNFAIRLAGQRAEYLLSFVTVNTATREKVQATADRDVARTLVGFAKTRTATISSWGSPYEED